jgi:hypothetical protein
VRGLRPMSARRMAASTHASSRSTRQRAEFRLVRSLLLKANTWNFHSVMPSQATLWVPQWYQRLGGRGVARFPRSINFRWAVSRSGYRRPSGSIQLSTA